MKNKKMWMIIIVVIALAGTGYFFRAKIMSLFTGKTATAQASSTATGTVAIRPATDTSQVNAAGNIALAHEKPVVFQAAGLIAQVAVQAGDQVAAGDLLAALDTTDLERSVNQAGLTLDTQKNALDKLEEPADPAEIAAARAALASAKEKLAELKAGPKSAQVVAAQAALTAAQASYQDLMKGKTTAELTQLSAAMHKAFITLKQAQEAYNKIAYSDTIGSSQQAMDLQTATIDYDTAKAAYDVATAPPTDTDKQAAIKAIKQAESDLATLSTTQTDLAAAEAEVATAESNLNTLLKGSSAADIEGAKLAIEQAQLTLDTAQVNLDRARLHAPISGTITAVNVTEGSQATSGLNAISMADLSDLELTVNVAEVDIGKVHLNQPAKIALDAFPDRAFSGVVSRIAPTNVSGSGVINYAVTVQLDKLNLEGVRPGMTAVATIADKTNQQAWLVPTTSLQEFEGKTTVTVMRNGQSTPVAVVKGISQGEWTTVQSTELRSDDKVVGEVATFVNSQQNQQFRGPFGGGAPH